MIRFIHVIYSE